jgi:hypothetical protein
MERVGEEISDRGWRSRSLWCVHEGSRGGGMLQGEMWTHTFVSYRVVGIIYIYVLSISLLY